MKVNTFLLLQLEVNMVLLLLFKDFLLLLY